VGPRSGSGHFDDYRYSADLDFSLVDGLAVDGALDLVETALADSKKHLDAPVLRLSEDTPPRIEYVGPLGARPRQLKLDLADDELVDELTSLPIATRYEDQNSASCRVYTLDEVAAEKLRCVMQRLQCRDLFDLHELLVSRGVDAKAVWPAFERKARHRGRDPDRFGEFFERRVSEWKRRWDRELVEYLSSFAHFEETLRAVRRELRFALGESVG
jgi:predicted nucleotidyltransferase component of viral defense system